MAIDRFINLRYLRQCDASESRRIIAGVGGFRIGLEGPPVTKRWKIRGSLE